MFTQIIDPFLLVSSHWKPPRSRPRPWHVYCNFMVDEECASAKFLEEWTPKGCSDHTSISCTVLEPKRVQAAQEAVRVKPPVTLMHETREMQNISVSTSGLSCNTQADDVPFVTGVADCVDANGTEYVMIDPIHGNMSEDALEHMITIDTVATTPPERVDTASEKTDFVWIENIQSIVYHNLPREVSVVKSTAMDDH